MFLTSGRVADCATSKAARTVPTWNPRTSSVGSGQRTVKRSPQRTASPTAGDTTLGVRLDTRSSANLTTLNSTSTVPPSLACLSSTMSTTMASPGTTWLAITRSQSFVRIAMSCSIISPLPIKAFASKI